MIRQAAVRAIAMALAPLVLMGCQVADLPEPPPAEDLALHPDPLGISSPSPALVANFVGCYELSFDVPRKDLAVGHPALSSLGVELRPDQVEMPFALSARLRPEPRMTPFWSIRHGEAVFDWSNGHAGYRFRLSRDDSGLEGFVSAYTDFQGPQVWRQVDIVEGACAN